jgi:hypothetical protein
VPELSAFDYAVIRVVPRVEREEFVNAGLVFLCLERQFLGARVHVDASRLRALWPSLDLDLVRDHLDAFPRICSGDPAAGPIAELPARERFHVLVAPRSTMIQVSAVHSGLCDDPQATFDRLFQNVLDL